MKLAGKDIWEPKQITLPGMGVYYQNSADVIFTPEPVARDIISHYSPRGKILDPCRGSGAFWNNLKGAEWCEVSQGKDFFQWKSRVDWIVSNPPYSIFTRFLKHSMSICDNIVFLIPIQKVFISRKIMETVWNWGGIPEIYMCGDGPELGWNIGFCIGEVHFKKDYRGPIEISKREQ